MRTKQSFEEVIANAKAFLRLIEPVKFLLLADGDNQTPEQFQTAQENAAVFHHWLARNRSDGQGNVDYSLDSIVACYKAVKDSGLLVFAVAPKKHSQSTITQDERSGKIIRDLRRERTERQEQEAAEVRERSERKNLEQRYQDANRKGAINLAWAACREYVASYPGGRTYGERARHREALAGILKSYSERPNGNPAECMSALRDKAVELSKAPLFG
jgi:hypothetical protein